MEIFLGQADRILPHCFRLNETCRSVNRFSEAPQWWKMTNFVFLDSFLFLSSLLSLPHMEAVKKVSAVGGSFIVLGDQRCGGVTGRSMGLSWLVGSTD